MGVDDRREDLRRALRERGLTVFGLAGAADGSLAGWETSDEVLTCVRVRYGAAGSWLVVETARRDGTIVLPTPLSEMLEHHLRLHGVRFTDLAWRREPGEVVVDGHPVPGDQVRAGDDWWAARALLGATEITLMAHRWGSGTAVRALADADVEALITAPRTRPSVVRAAPEPVPAEMTGEPHRGLVDAALRVSSANREWRRDGGPVPTLPGYWGELWAAAVRRQAELAGQPEPEARRAVGAMLDQLTTLQNEAGWFRADAVLRERAIAETLLHSTGLTAGVPSRAAQEAWHRRGGGHADAEHAWIEAWHAWALGR